MLDIVLQTSPFIRYYLMSLKYKILLLGCICFYSMLLGQDTSFQITTDVLLRNEGLVVNNNDEIGLVALDFSFSSTPFYILDNFDKVNSGTSIKKFTTVSLFTYHQARKVRRLNNTYVVLFEFTFTPFGQTGLAVVNMEQNSGFIKGKDYYTNNSADFQIDESNNIILAISILPEAFPFGDKTIVEIRKINANGDSLLVKGIEFIDTEYVRIESFEIHPDGFYILNGITTPDNHSFLLKIDLHGNPIGGVSFIENYYMNDIEIDSDGNIYGIGFTNEPFSFTDNTVNSSLIKFDKDFNILWSKVLYAESFEFNKATLKILPDGNLIMAYSTFGAFPVILAKLSNTAEIIWQRGYPLFEPQIEVLSDGALVMVTRSHFDEMGNTFIKNIISKTDTLGFIEGCEVFETCLKVNDVNLSFGTLKVMSFEGLEDFDHEDLIAEDTVFTFSDFCDNPTPPSPEFQIPDTLCVGECLKTFDTFNHFAHGIEWQLTGINVDSLLKDSTNFEYCFSEPGEYQLAQTIWFLGCDYSFDQTIVVLEDLEAQILSNNIICEASTVLFVDSNRPIIEWRWSSGDTVSNLNISQSDTFLVEVGDGFCTASDTTEIIFIADLVSGKSILELPNDTTICEAHLPFILIPNSEFNLEFTLNGNTETQPIFELKSAGEYRIGIFIKGCFFEKTYQLTVDECKSVVYFPNIFSPNNDGFNDLFFPQGNTFLAQKLVIYDRWGGQIFEGLNTDFYWNGKVGSQKAPTGVYVYSFEFLNVLTNEKEMMWGDVTLVR